MFIPVEGGTTGTWLQEFPERQHLLCHAKCIRDLFDQTNPGADICNMKFMIASRTHTFQCDFKFSKCLEQRKFHFVRKSPANETTGRSCLPENQPTVVCHKYTCFCWESWTQFHQAIWSIHHRMRCDLGGRYGSGIYPRV